MARFIGLAASGAVAAGCAFWGGSETNHPGQYHPGQTHSGQTHSGQAVREAAAHESVEPGSTYEPPIYAAAPPVDVQAGGLLGGGDEARSGRATTDKELRGPADSELTNGSAFDSAGAHASDEIEDEIEADEHTELDGDATHARSARRAVAPHPLANLSALELRKRLEHEPSTLGPMSIGAPNGGALMNAVQLPENERWQRVSPSAAWGTRETVDFLSNAIGRVVEQFPDSLPVAIGHISERNGGPLRPHRSHQAGADVDVGYYHKPEAHKWYQRATRENLDLPRTWALVRALITETDVRMILIDHSVQAWLREYAESIDEDGVWLDDIFGVKGSGRPALIRHAPGHATHLHVRFYNPIAEETARRCYSDLVAMGKIKLQPSFISYKARKGDTLLALAKRFGTSVKAIKRVNGLRSNTILAKRVYKIPSAAKHKISMGRTQTVPPRRLPPSQSSNQSLSQR